MSIDYIPLAIAIIGFGQVALKAYKVRLQIDLVKQQIELMKLQIELARLQADIRRREQLQVDVSPGARRFPRRSRCSRSSAR